MSHISSAEHEADLGKKDVDKAQAEMLALLWERHYLTNIERINVLERAALAMLEDVLDEDLRSEALVAAHKLAGSLGTFGLDEGTRVARIAEESLRPEIGDARSMAEAVVDLLNIVASPDAADSSEAPGSRDTSEKTEKRRSTLLAGLIDGQESTDLQVYSAAIGNDLDGRSLLISEDQQLVERMQVAAAARGQDLLVAASANGAITAHTRQSVGAVLVDMDLSDEGGVAALSAMQEHYPAARTFVLAGDVSFWKRIDVARLGSSGYLQRSESPKRILEQAASSSWRTAVHSATVVALDDDPMQHDLLHAMLDKSIFDLNTTSDPLTFWELLETSTPDAVLLDLRMPWLDGLTVCRAIRAEPRFQHLPVLVLTAETNKEVIAEVFNAGADDYVAKPIGGPELRARLMSHVERKHLAANAMGADDLTGLSNRHRSEERLSDLIGLARRRGEPVSLALIKIDHLERINVHSGRVTGDVVINALSALLTEHLRAEDVVGRWSSEEFVLGLYGAETQQSRTRLESLLDSFSKHRFVDLEGGEFGARFSAGLTEFPRDGTDTGQLLGAAERVLHQATTTRGGVRSSEDLSATGDSSLEQVDVVVVDDDEVLSDLLLHTLEANGYTVRHLGDGLEAVDLLGNGLISARVVLLDVGLPGMDGFSVLRSLRTSGALESTEVIMLTARSGTPETVNALDLGAVDFVSKPFNVAVLLGRIEKVLRRGS